MLEHLDLELKSDKKDHSYFLLMDDITQESGKLLVEYILSKHMSFTMVQTSKDSNPS